MRSLAQITIKQLEAFVQIADSGGFRSAAERLNTTQPSISARINALEAQLGLKVMDRDAGSVALTPVGERLLLKARKVLSDVEDLLQATGDPGVFSGTLRLGVTEMIAHSWLSDFLTEFAEIFPNVAIELTVDISSEISAALFGKTIDLALQSGPFDRQTSSQLDLGQYPLVWVAAPKLGLGNASKSIKDIADFRILTHARKTLPYEQLTKHLDGLHTRLVPSTHLATCLQMAVDGIGIACLPAAMVQAQIAQNELAIINYHWSPDPLDFYARFASQDAPIFVKEAAKLARSISARHQ